MAATGGEVTDVKKEFQVNEYSVPYLKGVLVYNPETKKWGRGVQSLTESELTNVISR